MAICPLVDSATYKPDTVNLTEDLEAKDFWFNCLKELIDKISVQVLKSAQNDDDKVQERVENFKKSYKNKLELLKNSQNKETLSVRTLLELNEKFLKSNGFDDPWKEQKKIENDQSIKLLASRLNEIDKIVDPDEKWLELFRGVLAGNMFDYGAVAVQNIIEENKNFGLQDAITKIQPRPWLFDGIDKWLERMKGKAHVCAVIFTDNSGVDIVLGVLPFARELLKRKTKVILCANAEPALNDVTYTELVEIIDRCCSECDIINQAYKSGKLLVYENGQYGCCLNFLSIPQELCDAMEENKTDLLIIEGMGRALHTNLNAKFKCETLKLAVIKNKWLANRLEGDLFSIICKYENV